MKETYRILSDLLDNRYTMEELERINETYFEEHPLPYHEIMKEGVLEILHYLKQEKFKIALCSSSPLENITHVLKSCAIRNYFDFVVSGEQFEKSKPNPEIYQHAAKVLQVKEENCIVIEDSKYGIEAGYNAGMTVIGIADLRFQQDQSKASVVVENLMEALEWIQHKK